MSVKKTKMLVAELKMIADTVASKHCRDIILEAADRLEDTDKIARFFRNLAESSNIASGKRRRRKNVQE